MDKQEYQNRCEELFQWAKDRDLELTFNSAAYDCKRLDCLWYGGHLATIAKGDDKVILECNGDVRATLYPITGSTLCVSVTDKNNQGKFMEIMQEYILNDEELHECIDKERLFLGNNNWIEYNCVVNGAFVDLGMQADNILDDDILEAIECIIQSFDYCIDQARKVQGGA